MSMKLKDRRFSETFDDKIVKMVYDSEGNLIEITNKLPSGLMRWVDLYDRNGFVTEEKEYEGEKLTWVRRYTYETDEHGNWRKRYTTSFSATSPSLGFTPLAIAYREIVYFEG